MRFRFLTLLAFMTLCALPLLANAATYNWYFSNDANGNAVGNDTTGNGSVSQPWKTLSKAQKQINTLGSGDIANLYFDRGDTWTAATESTEIVFDIGSSGPIVHIDAYGSGDKPIFDGGVSDFSAVSSDNCPGFPCRYDSFFNVQRNNCSISNVEIQNVYGIAIILTGGEYFTLSNSEIHDIGQEAIAGNANNGAKNNTVEYNTIHTCQELNHYGKAIYMWGGGVNFMNTGASGNWKDNTIRYNLIYDIYGEGINAPNSTIEYNVIGDTASIGIDVSPQDWDTTTAVVRYNFIIMSDWSSSIYDNMGITGPHGIRVYDEASGGYNGAADISIYGNTIINRGNGIQFFCNEDCNNPFGSVKIYNNLVIDSHDLNYFFSNLVEATAGYAYNNVSIYYDRTGKAHTSNSAHANWTFSHNAFYPVDGTNIVGTGWTSNYVTGDPKLPGEPAVDWDGLTGSNYFHMVNFGQHLYISSDSNLANAGKLLGSGYNSMFLTAGTDFSKFKFQRISQPDSAKWHIGPIIPEDIGKPNNLPPPKDLSIIP